MNRKDSPCAGDAEEQQESASSGDSGQACPMTKVMLSNEELIAKFRDWQLVWKPTDQETDERIAYISRLAEFAAPIDLSKVTKAVTRDFYREECARAHRAGNLRSSFTKIIRASIFFDAFLGDLRAGRI